MMVTMSHTTTATLLLVWTAFIIFPCGTCDNVAINKSYTQSSMSSSQQGANAGADDDRGTCVLTRSEAPYLDHPWYEVDLGRVYPVYLIYLYARADYQNPLPPFTITIDGETYGNVTGSPFFQYVRSSEVMYGQNVRVTLDRTDQPLNLCEFQMYVSSLVDECLPGQFGPTCDLECNDNCGQGPGKNFCYETSGYCYDGCVDGWYGYHCSTPCSECRHACHDGRYGNECEYSCPATYCQQCDQLTGACSNCIPASFLQTPNCTDCIDGYYKPEGQKWCIQCWWTCKSGTVCDQTTGQCPACPPGKHGDRCDQVCDNGMYGEDCADECGHCANGDPCDPVTGRCAGGCEDGWKDTVLCKEDSNGEGSTAEPDDDDNTAVIAGSMGAGLVILGIVTIILVVFILRRRRQQPAHFGQSTETDTTEMSNIPQEKGLTKIDDQHIYPQQEGYVNAAQVPDDGLYENADDTYSELATSSQHEGAYTGLAKP